MGGGRGYEEPAQVGYPVDQVLGDEQAQPAAVPTLGSCRIELLLDARFGRWSGGTGFGLPAVDR
jgi:hypothetical protein